ncbi:hypothetical protein [Kitasatospora xanthocidica]|uniref:hypothetical protein n=1 Tax=Kitasatospora xanthocidica TaxID=83382 RepID=UPI00216B0F45|nr:hypothetical protein [Kitasatospora xanthocidica]
MLIRLTGLVAVEHEDGAPQHLSSAQAQVAFARLVLERSSGTSRDSWPTPSGPTACPTPGPPRCAAW